MKAPEIILIVACSAIVLSVVIAAVIRKIKGKTCCGCDCCSGSCPHCKSKTDKQKG